jgi:hypothetical protein
MKRRYLMKLFRILVLLSFIFIVAGCNREESGNDMPREKNPDSELIREEGTNVAAIDNNNDGMVYQCPMDYQVIADQMESCPICKMDLEEYTIADAQTNLENHYKE